MTNDEIREVLDEMIDDTRLIGTVRIGKSLAVKRARAIAAIRDRIALADRLAEAVEAWLETADIGRPGSIRDMREAQQAYRAICAGDGGEKLITPAQEK